MRDVARAAGVSQAAVSYAFSNSPKVSEQQRRRIYEVAGELGFSGPNVVGSSLRSGRIGAVGVMVADSLVFALEDPSTTLLMKGIAEVGELAQVALTLLPLVDPAAAGPAPGGSPALRGLVDGVVLHNVPADAPVIAALLEHGVPTVAIDSPDRPDLPFVGIDNHLAGRRQLEHVLDLGHRRIGVLTDRLRSASRPGRVSPADVGDGTEIVVRERLRGYLDACTARGLPHSALTIVEAGGIDRASGQEATRQLLALGSPTAVVATADVHAVAAVQVLRSRGLAVPGAVSVIGFDDAPVAELLDLTTIRQPLVEKGREAATILLDRIAGGRRLRSIMAAELLVRGTTAPPGPAQR